MSKLFYDHLIVIEEIITVLDGHDVSDEGKKELLETIDETMHHHIFDTILTHLPKKHHETFLEKVTREPHNESILSFLKEKTTVDIEDEIKKAAKQLKQKIRDEIKKSVKK